jgi:hypothetical protein
MNTLAGVSHLLVNTHQPLKVSSSTLPVVKPTKDLNLLLLTRTGNLMTAVWCKRLLQDLATSFELSFMLHAAFHTSKNFTTLSLYALLPSSRRELEQAQTFT